MSNRIKLSVYLFIILLIIAAYHDLNPDELNPKLISENSPSSNYANKSLNFQVISYQIQPNEQFLSIIEKLNPNSVIYIDQFINDFQALNPTANIYQLETAHIYLFPIYD